MDQEDAVDEDDNRPGAVALLNKSLAREGYEVFYALDKNSQKLIYKHTTGSQIKSDIAVYDNNFYFTSGDGKIYVLQAANK